jgi:cell division protein FtsA
LSVSGCNISSQIVRVETVVKQSKGAISHAEIDHVLEMAHRASIPADRQVITAFPVGFILDGTEGIRDPAGMYGNVLGAEVHMIMGSVGPIRNLTSCVNAAELAVDGEITAQALAAAEAVLSDQEKQLGVVLVDIGGGTTDMVLYTDGVPWHTASIPLGGINITKDISYGLKLPQDVAEEIKLQYATVVDGALDDETEIDAPGFYPGKWTVLQQRDLAMIVVARMEELLELIKDEIRRTGYFDVLPAGVVFTGGGSELHGLEELASAVLGLPVRQGVVPLMRGMSEDICRPEFATSIGLVVYAAKLQRTRVRPPMSAALGTVAERLGSLMRSLIPMS